ncbi:hypothetical protein HY384_02630 [Candidatus Daviesbacteria bacterium]|nr:hypothetical protein [Candidatus Daviesbacteria bacterium]
MKPLLLHGPAKISSRKKLIELKQKFDTNNVVVFEEGFDLQAVLGTMATPSLLSQKQLIILENPSEDLSNFPLSTFHDQLVLWFDHSVNEKRPIIEWFKKNGQILFFPENKEVSVFPFLDSLAAGDKKAYLMAQKLKDEGFDIFYFIIMTFYLLRNLVVTPKNAPQFVAGKLQRQRQKFPLERIKRLYHDVLWLDFKIKSGLLEKEQAEFLLINKFIQNEP